MTDPKPYELTSGHVHEIAFMISDGIYQKHSSPTIAGLISHYVAREIAAPMSARIAELEAAATEAWKQLDSMDLDEIGEERAEALLKALTGGKKGQDVQARKNP